jgi:glycosyltransferase involved in cell wall biosynthesis
VGSGPEKVKLRALAQELGAKVEFIGFVGNAELMEYYRRARGLLFPGVEDFGIVPVEAIASGCPVVAFQSGGILDSMTDDTAEFYRTESVEGLQQAMVNFEKRTFCDEALRDRAAEFAPEKFLSRFEQILDRALSEWRRRPAS